MRSTVQPSAISSSSNSFTVRKWILGESCQLYGKSLVSGARPLKRYESRTDQWPKLGKVIRRGGEKNRPREFEEFLRGYVVGLPDERLGENHGSDMGSGDASATVK